MSRRKPDTRPDKKQKNSPASRKHRDKQRPGEKRVSGEVAQTKPSQGRNQNTPKAEAKKDAVIQIPRRPPAPTRQPETLPVILKTLPTSDYALIDSGNGQKLERYGPYTIVRPEAQALWQKAFDEATWQGADAIFTGDTDEDGMGRWNFPKLQGAGKQMEETWPMQWQGLNFYGRFTSFRHVGVFPEQDAHWRFMEEAIHCEKSSRSEPVRLLNLFGYTGIASLIAARAGAHVTHVDASKKAIGWARENQALAGLDDLPIRWICDDAIKFCEREIRRGNSYDAILLDPPKFGRGPKGEVWQLFDHLPHMVDLCRELMSDQPLFTILTSYSIRSSFFAMHELFQEVFGDLDGSIESGELVIGTENSQRVLSTSLFSRWLAPSLSGE